MKSMKRVKRVMGIIFLIGCIYTSLIVGLIAKGHFEKPKEKASTMLILGAQVKGKNPAYPSQVLKERLDSALIYLKQNPQTIVIVCGGKGTDESDTEANVMAHYLNQNGISAEQILKESTSTRTKENILNAKDLYELGSTVIVTNDFHATRAKILAQRIGIHDVSVLPSKTPLSYLAKSYVRETCALGYALLFDW